MKCLQDSRFYIYQHRRLDTNQIFYVGRGVGYRATAKTDRNKHWKHIVDKHGYSVEYLVKDLPKELADLCEIETIDIYKRRGVNLVNITPGGDGGGNGIPLSKKHKQKISDTLKGRKKPEGFGEKLRQKQLGKKLTKEHCEKLSKAHIGIQAGDKHPMAKKVVCVETNTVFSTQREAVNWLRSIGHTKASDGNISVVCSGKKQTAYGFTWKNA